MEEKNDNALKNKLYVSEITFKHMIKKNYYQTCLLIYYKL
jgi:hypothetical protein